jgi:hypothetical protein
LPVDIGPYGRLGRAGRDEGAGDRDQNDVGAGGITALPA